MLKKGLWVLLALVFVFIIGDFVIGLNEEETVREQASTTTPVEIEESFEEDNIDPDTNDTDESVASQGSMMQYGISPGNIAYDFELQDMEGNIVQLSDFRGQKVFLNFWASWCPPCRVEMPHLQEFYEEQVDVVVLGVNVTSSESNIANVASFMDELNLTFPNVYGTDDIATLYSIESLPTSYFIDSKGLISERVVGPVTKDILQARFSLID
ncbi:hypothetical protein GCM10008932_14220 [Alkalibacterium iburiense]|uniref:Thioredoxin domain-containing protein n=1 Tax=Alkalibacterium iburiense TaxID=290589 RepID=A0ABN0XG66_9LACT